MNPEAKKKTERESVRILTIFELKNEKKENSPMNKQKNE